MTPNGQLGFPGTRESLQGKGGQIGSREGIKSGGASFWQNPTTFPYLTSEMSVVPRGLSHLYCFS